jgi:hypothetical protein
MEQETAIAAVGHAIQLSVAPVFLLSGIAGLLAVMTNRLSRIVDRAREVEARLPASNPGELTALDRELRTLSRRAKFIYVSITLCTITALFVSAVVATLFVGAFLAFDASVWVAVLFVSAMAALFVGLMFFLREIFTATAALRIGPRA